MEKRYIFGIDLGGTSAKLAILDTKGNFIQKWTVKTDLSDSGKHIIPNIASSFHEALNQWNLHKEEFLGVGMGAPGPILENGVITVAVNLGWKNYPLRAELEKHMGLPAFVENDANCAALGEMWKGAGRGYRNMVFITLGTGVGGGVIVDGEVVGGSKGAGGEIGHMTVQTEGKYLCNCGKKGCLETLASATGVVRLAKEKLDQSDVESELRQIYEKNGEVTSKDVFDAAANNDRLAVEIAHEVGFYLGYSFAMVTALLNPEAIIVGGGVSKAGDTLLDPVKRSYNRFAFPASKDDTLILPATLGNDAGVIGAGWLVKSNVK